MLVCSTTLAQDSLMVFGLVWVQRLVLVRLESMPEVRWVWKVFSLLNGSCREVDTPLLTFLKVATASGSMKACQPINLIEYRFIIPVLFLFNFRNMYIL